jgi:Raf kinase inhibitor-like YbhB/YbcL family protein
MDSSRHDEGNPMTALALPRTALGALVAVLLVGCSSTSSPGDILITVGPSLTVTSTDFVAGGELDPRHSADRWGHCSGENLNPQLSWSGAPEGTVTYAITMLDRSANDYSHWVHVNIPAGVTSVATGGSATLPGVAGRNDSPSIGYFGPCPPGPNHRYEFIVWALDAELDIPAEPTGREFFTAAQGHVLAQGSIIGLYSPAS